MKLILFYTAAIGVGLLGLRFLILFIEPRLTFFPVSGLTRTPEQMGIPFEEIAFKTEDGETVYAWWIKQAEARSEILFFHGNGGNLSNYVEVFADLYSQKFSIFALDYRGYGKSSGVPSEEGVYRDTKAFIQYFWGRRHDPSQRVVYWGRSLGGTTAAYATTVRQPDGLILEAAFPSKQSLLDHYPFYKIISVFSRYGFPTSDFLRNVSCPVLVIHGDKDRTVPIAQGQKLFKQLQTEKYFYRITGADHNDIHLFSPQEYRKKINEFLERINHG